MPRLPLLLLLAACSGQPAGPCRLRMAAELPVSLDRGRLEVAVRINGTETPMVLDTGAERSVLSAATVASLLLARSRRSATRLTGVTGAGDAVSGADAYARLDMGGAHFSGKLAVADLPDVGGLVGADLLSAYDVELDVPDRRVRLWTAPGCGAADLPWTGPRTTLPAELTDGGRIRLPVMVDGAPVEALLDSGASVTLMSADAARRLGVTQAMLGAGAPGRGVGAGAIAVAAHRFASLAVGAERMEGPVIAVAEVQITGARMLLGLDYLRTRRVWVSYRTGQVFAQRGG